MGLEETSSWLIQLIRRAEAKTYALERLGAPVDLRTQVQRCLEGLYAVLDEWLVIAPMGCDERPSSVTLRILVWGLRKPSPAFCG